jgi:hypothetical protein
MSEHSAAIQQQVLTTHTPLAQALKVSLPDPLLQTIHGKGKMKHFNHISWFVDVFSVFTPYVE